jgi:hypothetical protein
MNYELVGTGWQRGSELVRVVSQFSVQCCNKRERDRRGECSDCAVALRSSKNIQKPVSRVNVFRDGGTVTALKNDERYNIYGGI